MLSRFFVETKPFFPALQPQARSDFRPKVANDNGGVIVQSPLTIAVIIRHEWKRSATQLCCVERNASDPQSHPDHPLHVPRNATPAELDQILRNMTRPFTDELVQGMQAAQEPPTSVTIVTRVSRDIGDYSQKALSVPSKLFGAASSSIQIRQFLAGTYRPFVQQMIRDALSLDP